MQTTLNYVDTIRIVKNSLCIHRYELAFGGMTIGPQHLKIK